MTNGTFASALSFWLRIVVLVNFSAQDLGSVGLNICGPVLANKLHWRSKGLSAISPVHNASLQRLTVGPERGLVVQGIEVLFVQRREELQGQIA